MNMKLAIFAFSMAAIPAAAQAQGQGLDCRKPHNRAEAVICGDTELMRLDAKLGALVQTVRGETSGVDGETGRRVDPLGRDQAIWETRVRDKCRAVPCLKLAYERRIADVRRRWGEALKD